MREQLITELTAIFRAVSILSPTLFSFAGRPVSQPTLAVQPMPSPYPQPNPLVAQLQQQLYQYCFTQRFTGQLPAEPTVPAQDDNLLQELSAANTSRERWEAGWQIYQVLPSGQVWAHRYGLTRMLWPGEFVTHEGPGVAPRVGASVSVFFARESLTMQPGFYFAFGESVADQQDDTSLVRFYWNIKPSGATNLIRLVTQELNRFQVPFRFKTTSRRANYVRLDAAVLYVNKRFFRIVAELVPDVCREIPEHLQPETPLFTKRLAPGLALAEDPGNGESFGMSRSRIVAEGIWNAYVQGSQAEQARLQEVINAFSRYEIPFERPYLNPRSIDHYELPDHQA